ncbi:hypothetical protein NK8_50920 [Caballeronia sp. NK8]|nr:hypothetical protein NK8_50920 [Caballeronia sp. NK8]
MCAMQHAFYRRANTKDLTLGEPLAANTQLCSDAITIHLTQQSDFAQQHCPFSWRGQFLA